MPARIKNAIILNGITYIAVPVDNTMSMKAQCQTCVFKCLHFEDYCEIFHYDVYFKLKETKKSKK